MNLENIKTGQWFLDHNWQYWKLIRNHHSDGVYVVENICGEKEHFAGVADVIFWGDDNSTLAELARYLAAEEGYTAHNIADLIEKPWKFTDKLEEYLKASQQETS